MKVVGIIVIVLLLVAVGSYFFIGTRSTETTNLVARPDVVNPLLSDTLDVNQLRLLAVSVQDQKAVLSLGDGQTMVVSKGGLIGSAKLKLLQVTHQKIVLKSNTNEEMYFVYVLGKGYNSKKRSLVQKVSALIEDKQPPDTVLAPTPVMN